MKPVIPIFFSVDDRYAPYLAVAMTSMKLNASKRYDYDIIILHQQLSDENKRRLREIGSRAFRVRFEAMDDMLKGFTDKSSNRLRCDYYTMTIYYRIFIPAMFPEYDKGIYLDSDIVVPGDVSELYETELGDSLIGACTDLSIQETEPLVRYVEQGIGVEAKKYVNSGILLMDMDGLRKAHLDEKFLYILGKYQCDSIAPDQDYINALCRDVIFHLPDKFDIMPNENREIEPSPVIVHYNLFAKPWNYKGIQYEDLFWKYAIRTAYYRDLKDELAGYTDEQKAQDMKCLEDMAAKGVRIAESEVNFRTIFESGTEERLKRLTEAAAETAKDRDRP